MCSVDWVQNDKTLICRDLYCEGPFSLAICVENAIRDLVYAIAFNEDRRTDKLSLNEPLHLIITCFRTNSDYNSAIHLSDLKQCAFAPGGTADSLASFITAHVYHATIFENDLGVHYWPVYVFLDNSQSPELDVAFSLFANEVYTVKYFGSTWLEDMDGRSVKLTCEGFEYSNEFYGLVPTKEIITALEGPLKSMRAYSRIKGKCSVCNSAMVNDPIAYCERCQIKYALPAESAYSWSPYFDIQSLRKSKLCSKYWLNSPSQSSLSVNEKGSLYSIVKDVPF